MASAPRRAKLVAEIIELGRLQRDCIVTATFGGWTREQEAAHDEGDDRLVRLMRELEAP